MQPHSSPGTDKEHARWSVLKAERASRLEILKTKLSECVDDGEGKLKNLLQQIELDSDFMAGRNAHLEAQATSEAANKRARRKEKEEDDDLLKGLDSLALLEKTFVIFTVFRRAM